MGRRLSEESLAGLIRALNPGESFSRTRRLAVGTDEATDANGALAKLRNSVNQAVGRIRKDYPGSNFRVESTVGLTDDKQVLLATVAATCMGESEDEETDI